MLLPKAFVCPASPPPCSSFHFFSFSEEPAAQQADGPLRHVFAGAPTRKKCPFTHVVCPCMYLRRVDNSAVWWGLR